MVSKRVIQLLIPIVIVSAVIPGYLGWKALNTSEVFVEWTTASELNTAGFNIYRSEVRDGPYIKINAHLIPASSDPLTGSDYTYMDTDVIPGKFYYYELEDISVDGSMNRFGPIEVRAQRGGWIEISSTLALLLIGLMGIFYLKRT